MRVLAHALRPISDRSTTHKGLTMELDFLIAAQESAAGFHPAQVCFFVCENRSRDSLVAGCHISKDAAHRQARELNKTLAGKTACVRMGTVKRGLRWFNWRAVVKG